MDNGELRMRETTFIFHSNSLRAALRAVARWTPAAAGVSIFNFSFITVLFLR